MGKWNLSALVKASESRVYHRAHVAIAGDVLAGVLLGQIIWYVTMFEKHPSWGVRNKGDGRVWLAKSHVEWTEEIGLTRKQLRGALERLQAAGLIEVKTWRFLNVPTGHIWLNEDAVVAAMMAWYALCQKGQSDCAKTANPLCQNGQSITETTSETTTESTTSAKADSAAPLPPLGENVDAKDLLKHHQVAKGLKEEPRTMKVMKLDLLWRKLVAEKTGVFQQQLSGKELGYLKALMTQAGGEAGPVVEWAALNWSKLAFECDIKGGPSLGALVTHWQTALKLMLAKPKKVEAEPQGFDKPPSIPEPVKEEVEAPISAEDQLAMMNKYLKPDA